MILAAQVAAPSARLLARTYKHGEKVYVFKPQPDITAYELASLMSQVVGNLNQTVVVYPDGVATFANFKRHFEEVKP